MKAAPGYIRYSFSYALFCFKIAAATIFPGGDFHRADGSDILPDIDGQVVRLALLEILARKDADVRLAVDIERDSDSGTGLGHEYAFPLRAAAVLL